MWILVMRKRQNVACNMGLARLERSSCPSNQCTHAASSFLSFAAFLWMQEGETKTTEKLKLLEGWGFGDSDFGGAVLCLGFVFFVFCLCFVDVGFLDKTSANSPQARQYLISLVSFWNRSKSICNLHKTILQKKKKKSVTCRRGKKRAGEGTHFFSSHSVD